MGTEDFKQYYESLKKKFLEITEGLKREDFFRKTDFLVIFGTLPFFHIPKLISRLKKLKKVLLVEPKPEFLFLFLSFIDLQKFLKPGLVVSFVSNEQDFRTNFFAGFLPSLFSAYLVSYSDNQIETFKEVMEECFKATLIVRPFESISSSFEHTLKNLSMNPLVLREAGREREETVCIVGTGPSLNQSYDFLKKFKDQMVIVSLGSATRPLVLNEVVPDFVTALDPMPNMKRKVFKDIDKFSDSCFVGAFVVDPELVKSFRFEDRLFFGFETPGGIFEGNFLTPKTDFPTVLNYSLEVFYHFGFRKFLLIGVDLGTKDPKVIHAKGYALGEKMLGNKNLMMEEGNFGGVVFCPIDFWVSKILFERQIRKFKGITVYNLSNGVKIKGTVPFHQENGFPFEYKVVNKKDVKEDIKRLFERALILGIRPSKEAKKEFNSFVKKFSKALVMFNRYLQSKDPDDLETGIRLSLEAISENIVIGSFLSGSPFGSLVSIVGRYLCLIGEKSLRRKEFTEDDALLKLVKHCVNGAVKVQYAMGRLFNSLS